MTIKNFISLLDEPNVAAKKIKSAVTDSDGIVKYDKENKPGISNLLVIYSSLSGQSIEELEAQYADKGYGDFKGDLAEEVKKFLVDFQEKFNYYYENKEVLDEILDKGRDKASFVANKTLKRWKTL